MADASPMHEFSFELPWLGKRPDVEVWPRPVMEPEAFVKLAKSKNATFSAQCYRMNSNLVVWRAKWVEGDCAVILHGPDLTREKLRELIDAA